MDNMINYAQLNGKATVYKQKKKVQKTKITKNRNKCQRSSKGFINCVVVSFVCFIVDL